jgi:lipoprotein-anchoring transpeptidase ErfK/SrfK
MVVKRNGMVITSNPVSKGRDEYPSYDGVHVVEEKYQTKIRDSRTRGLTGAGAYRVEVAWATRISDSGEFVHAAPWSVDSQGYENVSHGCVNVSTEAAKWFYDTLIPGDPVIIKNTVGPPPEVWDGYGDVQTSFKDYET